MKLNEHNKMPTCQTKYIGVVVIDAVRKFDANALGPEAKVLQPKCKARIHMKTNENKYNTFALHEDIEARNDDFVWTNGSHCQLDAFVLVISSGKQRRAGKQFAQAEASFAQRKPKPKTRHMQKTVGPLK